jgi:thiamine pyrophosphate-dependent acetolactate synthase large subunit-like protein
MMRRDECLRVLARHVTDEIVVPVYTAAFDWLQINPRPLNYYSVGAMGLASSHGLGFALGRPDKRVIVLDGDGSLLMNLGSLVTIAEAAPRNLIHFVCHNGTYEANGGHPIPRSGRVDFAGLAVAAGYRHVTEFADLTDFSGAVGGLLRLEGPVFALLAVTPGPPVPMDYPDLYKPSRREAFRSALHAH